MFLFLVMAAALWGIGSLMRAPYRARFAMIGALYVAVLLAHLVLPADNPLILTLGGTFGGWLVLGGAGVLVYGYTRVLARLKAKKPDTKPAATGTFSEVELERYARHIVLREIGGPGQKKLKAAKVLVVGAGGLGSPALMYLAAAGVGTLGIIDDDVVDASNLQRQIIHDDLDVGSSKAFSASGRIADLNPFVAMRPYNRRLTEDIAAELFADYDLILDGSDNFDTRYLVNRAAVETDTPLISAAMAQYEGQISVFDPASGAPCYQCVFPEAPAAGLAPSCAEAGVLGPLPGVMGSLMAVEAIKLIAGAGEPLKGAMLIYDALYADTRRITVKPRADCPVCATRRLQRAPDAP
ncbi:HesA/MoeB/ThiF family protein [Aliiroseovarius sp. YM-037]|uniref:HesA/MoeB/ThiF family protein n=1 Tax=Aliiroseovarius sp. YM-037 TaxID=3341728 RepID=UPI003A802D57